MDFDEQMQLTPLTLTLPDTQDVEGIGTQSQDIEATPPKLIWGKLWPNKFKLKTIDMTEDQYTFGRADTCDICVTPESMERKKIALLSAISKVHFRIYKTKVDDVENVACLEDLSHNGTFVNGIRVGRGNKQILANNDIIAVANSTLSPYIFMNSLAFEGSDLPLEVRTSYAVSRKLGSGACGEVRLIFSKSNFNKYAMKSIVKKDISGNGHTHSLNNTDKIMNEVRILEALKHPCIIKVEKVINTPSTVYIILELMEGGELFDRIKNKGRLNEDIAKVYFYQVVLAVHYLHTKGITHRDLKPENILLATEEEITLTKVSDFGLSKLVDSATALKTFCGTPMYVAPEILITSGRGAYTNQVDVWSLGVILYACLSGGLPFNAGKKDISLQEQIMRGLVSYPSSRFKNVSPKALDLMKRMLVVDAKKRITIQEILLHPWLQDRDMRSIVNRLIRRENDENVARLPLSVQNGNTHVMGIPRDFKKRAKFE